MNLSTADNDGLRCMDDSNVLQNASHLVRSPLKVFGTSLGNLTLLPASVAGATLCSGLSSEAAPVPVVVVVAVVVVAVVVVAMVVAAVSVVVVDAVVAAVSVVVVDAVVAGELPCVGGVFRC